VNDPASRSNEELIGELRLAANGFFTADTLAADPRERVHAVIDEIHRRLGDKEQEVFVLPVSVTEAIRNHFGSGKRTFDAITKRVRFAYQVWQGKYGPWTPEQADYAEELCLWAINRAPNGTSPGHSRALVYTALDRIVNHEQTHQGFRRREGESIDITDALQEALS
jgi:hypothetical protein